MSLLQRLMNRVTPTPSGPTAHEALAPIAGVTLEQYADLCARMARKGDDPEVFARIAAEQGVPGADWEAARAGWTARMEDPATARHVVLPYMPLYQAALAQHGGPAATASYDDYIEMTAMINTNTVAPRRRPNDLDSMYARFGIDAIDWSQISTYWTDRLRNDVHLGDDFARKVTARVEELDARFLGDT